MNKDMGSSESINLFGKQVAEILGVSDDGRVLLHVENPQLLRRCKQVELRPIDKRKLSNKQRSMCWALIGAIAEWQGDSKAQTMKDMVNEAMKLDLLEQSGESPEEMFSLSDAPMSVICKYQAFLIDFIIENDIPTSRPLYSYADDLERYMYTCLANRHCCVCGKKADLHHSNLDGSRVGMGRDRTQIIHEGLSVMPLCREHHTEIHTMPENDFLAKYHLPGPIKLDKHLCLLLGVKATAD